MKIIGYISEEIINLLKLNIPPNTPILLGEQNEEHIKSRHLYEYEKYFRDIGSILQMPDYVGKNPKDDSILYVKYYAFDDEFIRVAIRVTARKNCFVKTLHLLSSCNAERYIEKGTLIKLDRLQK